MIFLRGIFLFIIIFILTRHSVLSQNWIKIYGEDVTCWARDLKENYDKGYILIGQVNPGPNVPQMHGWIIKTDINGNELWNKKLYSSQYQIACNGLDLTLDGGYIMNGVTTKLDPYDYDISIIKFNVCGQKEWCKIFSTPGNSDYGLKVKQIPGGYVALVKYFKDWIHQRIWLFKLDNLGDIIWQKLYAQSDTNIFNEEGRELLLTLDGGYLITGDASYLVPPWTFGYRHPLIIKTDSNGVDQWTLVFGALYAYKGYGGTDSYENQYGFFYATSQHFRDSVPLGDSPGFIKVSPDGEEVYWRDIFPNTVLGIDNTMDFINDSVMIISSSWSYSSTTSDSTGVIKVDTLGNVLKVKVLLTNVINTLRASTLTYDNKYLVTGGFSVNGADPHIYLFKLNYDLEYDSIYTRPFTYDSLCPNPIVSDTTNLDDCEVVTSIKTPEEYEEESYLKVYPNPSDNQITIEIPKYLVRKSSGHGMTATTIYHQWKDVRLEVFDLFGKLMFCETLPQQKKSVTLSVSHWSPGMYVSRLVLMNEVVAKVKFIVE